MKRGDIVICVFSGDYGKPRPAIIAQSDLFNPTHTSIVVCPITSHIIEAPLFRLAIRPNNSNKLKHASQIMIDKIITIKKEKIHQIIGRLSLEELSELDEALKLWLSL